MSFANYRIAGATQSAGNSMNQIYNWKRFWCPREGNINLMDGGYLSDPDAEYGHIYNPDVAPFSKMAQTPCLALLGEPGTGKSFAMKSERSSIEAQVEASGGQILWLDLRSFGSEERLVRELFRSETFTSWLSGDHQLHIFLDSLDECLLRVTWLGSLLVDELSKYPSERLRFRIACRTADWPNVLEIGLRKKWPDGAFKAFELAPLRRVDVESAARANEFDSDRFLADIDRKEVVPLAIKPVTLRFLLNTYKKQGSFPETQKELYLDGCRLLCEEVSESRIDSGVIGTLSTNVRLAIAARIAAVTVFANRFAVRTGINYGDVAEEDVAIRDLVGGFEIAGDEAEVIVTTSHIEEVLSTGLFSSRGFQRFGWAHQTYAEFLAALYVVKHQLSIKQIKDLIVHPGIGDERLVPQLHECAAWIAGMSPEVFRMISRVDPQVLLRSDVATTDAEDRAALVESLLTQYGEDKLLDLGWGRKPYDKLKHPGIANQLRPYITESNRGIQARHVAIDIAEACECCELQNDLLLVALNRAEPLTIRINAAYAINRIGDQESKAQLRPLAYGESGDDPDDELKGCGLHALWPHHISVDDLFGLLTHPKNPSLIGSYSMFLSSDIVSDIEPADLPTALRWAEQFQDFDDWRSFGELKKAILAKTWDNLDEPGIMETFARLVLSHLKGHRQEVDLDLTDTDKRRRLVAAILPLISGAESPWYLLIHSTPPLLSSVDLFWLIARLLDTQPIEEQRLLAKLIERTIDFSDSSHTDALVLAAEKNAILADCLAWLLRPVELGSPEVDEMKRQYAEQQKWQSRMPTRPLLDPPPQIQIEKMLEEFWAGDVSAWWRLNLLMPLHPEGQYDSELSSDLTALPGWKDASDLIRSRIVDSAKEYLIKAQPEPEKWLGTTTIYRPAFAGYRAFHLLLQQDEEYLNTLESRVWETWAPIIVAYPTDSEGTAREKQKALIRRAYQHAPEAVIESLLIVIDKEPSVLRKMEGCVDARLLAVLLAKLGDSDLSVGTMGSVLGVLLKNGVSEARSIAESLVQGVASSDDKARAKAKLAARLLLTETEDAGWSVVWPALNQDAEFAEEVISSIAHWGNRGSSPLFPKLSVDQLAELYVWLVRRYPPSEDPQHKGVYNVGPRDSIAYWRDSVLNSLKARGTPEACIAIESIVEQLPQLVWLKLVLLEAQQIARRETWKPPSPSDVIKVASYSKLVLSLHGIRTRGAWQKQLNSELQDAGLKHEALDYGFFGVLKLLIPYFRRRQVEWFRDEYTRIRERYPSETPSVIGHSFGTYLVATALERYREITFDRIIFSGSIVRQDFDWSRAVSSGQVNGVLNECAKKDFWVKLGSWLIRDAGPSGARGFNDSASGCVRQRHHELFSHSEFLYSLNYHENWIPFLKRGEPHELDSIALRQLNVRFVILLTGTFILLILLVWLFFIVRI